MNNLQRKEFIHVADTLTINAKYFLNQLLNFLNLGNVRSIISEQQITIKGKIKNNEISRILIIGKIHGVLGYIDVIPTKQNLHPRGIREGDFLKKSDKDHSAIFRFTSNREIGFKSASLEITDRIFVIRIFLLRELPSEFVFLLRNYVLTTT